MTAAATRRIFLLFPLDSVGTFAPPNVNVGAGEEYADEEEDSLCAASAGFSKRASAASAVLAGGTSVPCEACASRAGAGALAAPLPTIRAGLAGSVLKAGFDS